MTRESIDHSQLPEASPEFDYQPPRFAVVSLAVITLGGTPGTDDPGKEDTLNPFGSAQTVDDDYDDDPWSSRGGGDDPWGSRGGGG